MTTDRRTFLKLAAAGVATMAVGGSAAARAGRSASAEPFHWQKAPCQLCGAGCGVQVGVENGRVVAVAGDTGSSVNKGLLCVKGYHAGAALYGADRLTTPLLKRDGAFRAISWDAAIRIVADRAAMKPGGFAVYGSAQWTIGEAYVFQKFMKGGLSNNNLTTSTRFSEAAAARAARAVHGDDGPLGCFDDLDATNVVVVWGSNPAEEHPVLFSRVTDRRIGGAEITVVDIGSRRTRTTSTAQSFVRCRPHSEAAVLKGILRLLLVNKTWDKAFVTEHCGLRLPASSPDEPGRTVPFEEWRAALEPYTPDAVQRLSEVRNADLEMLADFFGNPDLRITSLWSEALNQRPEGEATNLLLHALHLLSGHVARPGDGPMALSGQPSECGSVGEVAASPDGLPGGLRVGSEPDRTHAERLWNLPAGRIQSAPGHEGIALWSRFSNTAEKGGDIHTIWVQAANPAQTLPNAPLLFGPSRKDPDKFLIVSDVYPTPTTLEADLVLPSSMWVEKNGMYGNLERRTQQWSRMVAPPGAARDDTWQAIAVAHELFLRGHAGMKDKDGQFLFDLAGGTTLWDWSRFSGVNVDRLVFNEYRPFAALRKRNLATYEAYEQARGLRWPVVENADGGFTESGKRHAGNTPGKTQLFLPADVVPVGLADKEYPFYLTFGPVVEHAGSGTITGRIPELRRAMPGGYLEMNRQDANRLGVVDGETVSLESRSGALRVPVWIEGRGSPSPGVLFAPVFDERMRPMALLPRGDSTSSTQPDLGPCAVRIRRLT